MLKLLMILPLLLLMGCSLKAGTVKQDGAQYGYRVISCVNMPDIADKVKDGLGKSKVCFRSIANVLVVPDGYPEDKL